MGIFDFFKKKPQANNRTVKISELNSFIDNKKKENQEKNIELSSQIKNSLKDFINQLNEKDNILKKINVNEKKADPRAKFIIRENLAHYIDNLDKLIKQLEDVNSENFVELIKDLDSLFIDFEQKSKLNFEKATFLIGKELGDVKDSINNFVQNLKKLLDENKFFLDSLEVISSLELKLEELKENEILVQGVEQKMNENLNIINSIESNILSKELEIEKIKSSDSYVKEISLEADIKIKNEELEKEIYELKNLINFKKLANIFHYDSKKMSTINEYKLNFTNAFLRDKLLSLIPLLNDANITDSHLSKKTNIIMQKEKDIEKLKKSFNKDDTNSLYDLNKALVKLRSEKEQLIIEKQKDNKRKEKIIGTKPEIMQDLRQLLLKVNVELLVD